MSYSKELLDEIEEIIDIKKEISHSRIIPILYDGRQYTIKIPKELAEQAGITRNDCFQMQAQSVMDPGGKKGSLRGHLIKHEHASSP
ncbi:MAG: hypothetical protein ACQESG_07450 [Nanobdellota archaeon]